MLALKVAVVVESVYIHLSLLIDSTSSIPSSRRKACLDGCLQNKIPSKLQRRKLSFFLSLRSWFGFVLGKNNGSRKSCRDGTWSLARVHFTFGPCAILCVLFIICLRDRSSARDVTDGGLTADRRMQLGQQILDETE